MTTQNYSTIYGPVQSWRVGKSLGVDLILDVSTCSFNCTYCQLGYIQNISSERKIFVPTERIIEDFKNSNWREADVITFSGSGEPTLALNISEVIFKIKEITSSSKPIVILTNATLLHNPQVRKDILMADIISAKLDAPNDEILKSINRPASGVNLDLIVEGIKQLKKEFKGKIQLQIMFMPQNKKLIKEFADLINEINPDEVALNTPTRPYPSGWDVFSRGAHGEDSKKIKFPSKSLKKLTIEEAIDIESELKKLTKVKIFSVYKN